MSWLFGIKSNPPPDDVFAGLIPPAGAEGGGGGSEPPKKDSGKKSESRDSRYSFDSSALERAAQAAKELEKSKHATEVS